MFATEINSGNAVIWWNGDKSENLEEIVYDLLYISEKEAKQRLEDLERRLSDVAHLTATKYSDKLYNELSVPSNGYRDKDTERLFSNIMNLFHNQVITYSNGLIERLAARFNKDISVYSDNQIRKLICMYGEGLIQYANELVLMFNNEMKVYTYDLVDRLSSKFDKEIGGYSDDFQKEICMVFEEGKKSLYNELPMSGYLLDADKKADICSIGLQFEAAESKPERKDDDLQIEVDKFIPTEGTRKHKKNRLKKMWGGLKKLVVCGFRGVE